MGIGGDMYEQHCIQEHLSSNECMRTRKLAIEAAKMAINASCNVDCPTMELVDMVKDNWRRGRMLLLYCYWTCFLPWNLARRFAPRL